MYPTEIAGLVLVDPTPEDLFVMLEKTRGPERVERDREEMAKGSSSMNQGGIYEYEEMENSFQQARESWPLPSVPVVLLTSIHPSSNDRLIWLGLHKEFLLRVPGAKHIVTEKSGHNIHSDEPGLVVDAIREIVTGRADRTQ
jgi:pimeloyl-ACP methyl ester carboxylesterase